LPGSTHEETATVRRHREEDIHRVHVLLLDQDMQYTHVLKQELMWLGVEEAVIAKSPQEALRHIKFHRVDVLVSELYLPLVRFIRTNPKSPNTRLPIVVSTSHLDFEHIAKARDAGVNSLVTKPVSAVQLEQHIYEALDSRHHPFIESEAYTGPDRRHVNPPPYRGKERRGIAGVHDRLEKLKAPASPE